jgi:catechol 2,3-dioxygenase-like lactoylglutathione lyase family enzyme
MIGTKCHPSPMLEAAKSDMKTMSWAHTGLAVRDLDGAVAFYQAAFGYEIVEQLRGMTQQVAAVTGIPTQSCDLAQLRSPISHHVLELIQFHGHENADVPAPIAPLRARPSAFGICRREPRRRTCQG